MIFQMIFTLIRKLGPPKPPRHFWGPIGLPPTVWFPCLGFLALMGEPWEEWSSWVEGPWEGRLVRNMGQVTENANEI